MSNILERLQALPPTHKLKIIIGTAVISLIGLGTLWANSIQTSVNNLTPETNQDADGSVLSASNHITVEYSQTIEEQRHVYFKVTNPTSDILNFSKNTSVLFSGESGSFQSTALTDRQKQPFPAKILSNTTVYGIIIFEDVKSDEGSIVFDDLYFENNPGVIFKESIRADFNSLKTIQELRS